MKKIVSISLVLIIVMSLFSGCNVAEKLTGNKEISCEGLTMEVPKLYLDMTETLKRDSIVFVYGNNDSAVLGLRESKKDIDTYFDDVETATDYAEVFVSSNGMSTTVKQKDGLPTFTYTATSDGKEFTYYCAAYASDDYFWIVQTYCYSENFSDNEADFLEMLKSVEV